MMEIAPHADIEIDTSGAKPSDLRQALISRLGMADSFQVQIRLLSFSYRRRIPDHSDIVFDMRFAENPHWVASLRKLDGRDDVVAEFLREDSVAVSVIESFKSILAEMLPRMSREGEADPDRCLRLYGRPASFGLGCRDIVRLASRSGIQCRAYPPGVAGRGMNCHAGRCFP